MAVCGVFSSQKVPNRGCPRSRETTEGTLLSFWAALYTMSHSLLPTSFYGFTMIYMRTKGISFWKLIQTLFVFCRFIHTMLSSLSSLSLTVQMIACLYHCCTAISFFHWVLKLRPLLPSTNWTTRTPISVPMLMHRSLFKSLFCLVKTMCSRQGKVWHEVCCSKVRHTNSLQSKDPWKNSISSV